MPTRRRMILRSACQSTVKEKKTQDPPSQNEDGAPGMAKAMRLRRTLVFGRTLKPMPPGEKGLFRNLCGRGYSF